MNNRNLGFGSQPLRDDELGDGDAADLRDALAAGRVLDASIDDVPVRVSADFTAGVMAAIEREPAPGAVGFIAPLRRRGFAAGFGESVRQAWAAIGAAGVPSFARATALAYVLVVAVAGVAVTGAATIGVGSALGIFNPAPTQSTPPVPSPGPLETLPAPTPQTAPPESDAAESAEPSLSPDDTDDHGGNSSPGSSSEPGDDHGGNSGPGSSDSDSGSDDSSGSGSGDGTPRPTDTPRPTGTPKPSQTPH